MYRTLRTVHLLCGVFALPLLVMYGISAIQMAHSKWFVMKPAVTEFTMPMQPGYANGRLLARDVMASRNLRGAIRSVEQTPEAFNISIVVPGTQHEVRYDRTTGATRVRTSAAGFMGMLNRLHHAAGLWHDYLPLKLWGALCGLVSLAAVGLSATGLWMWWLRREERKWGRVLLAANLAFSVTVLLLLRAAGP